MDKNLFQIKLLHTVIWAMFVIVIFYVLYAGITGRIGIFAYLAIAAVVIEGIVLAFNNGHCPLTGVAKRYTDEYSRDNFDIFLPNWLAKYNKIIFTSIFILGVLLVLIRVFYE